MDIPLFEALLARREDESIDFKQCEYDFSGVDKEEKHKKRAQFVKDVIAMYNTPRTEPAYIVLGVKRHLDGSYDLKGVSSHIDDAELRDKISPWVFPTPSFSYEPLAYGGLQFAVLVIPANRDIGPCLPTRDVGGQILRQYQVYFRRGSKNELANSDEQRRVFDWFGRRRDAPLAPHIGDQAWDNFAAEAHRFSGDYQYALVTHALPDDPDAAIGNLGRIDWSFVIDLDSASDVNGLFSKCRSELSTRRSLHLVVQGENPTLNFNRGTYWYFAKGLQGRESTLISGQKWVDWNRAYGNDLRNQLTRYAAGSASRPVALIALWDAPHDSDYLDSVLSAATSTFGEVIEILIVTSAESPSVVAIANRHEAKVFVIPLHQFCHGLATVSPSAAQSVSEQVSLPSTSGAPVLLDGNRLAWLGEEFDVIYPGIGARTPPDRTPGRDFLRGNEVTWYDLGLNYDVERDIFEKLQRAVRFALQSRRTLRVNLFHEPGAGGTTLAKRIAWSFRKDYPCLLLRRTEPLETSERLSYVASMTGLPILVTIDAGAITDRQADALYEQLAARHIPAVIFQALRRFRPSADAAGSSSVYLPALLTNVEAERFVHFLAREEPGREQVLREALQDPDSSARTPFYLALVTFERDFVRLREYVGQRLKSLTEVQQKCVGYLAIAHFFGQRVIPSQFFVDLFSLPPSRAVDMSRLLPEPVLGLLAQPESGNWRTAHPLVAEECMKQLFAPNNRDPELWRQSLSRWALDFLDFCRGTEPIPTDEGLDLVRRVFVFRDNSEILGYERAGSRLFAQIIDMIPSPEGRLEVVKMLTEVFPEEAHFWAHLGRFYSFVLQEYDNALSAVDYGISLQPQDHVLHHMKGMILRGRVYQMMAQKEPLDATIEAAEQAAGAFSEARRWNPEDEHGYISEAQMIVRVLDYAGEQAGSDALAAATSPASPKWLRESLQSAEHLLAQVRQNRGGETPSQYEQTCLASLETVHGKYSDALQKWDNLLSRQGVYHPPIRRQIVWTYLARNNRRWDRLSRKEIDRSVKLLEENLQEEPNDERNLRLWLQGVRQLDHAPSLDATIEKVAYWRANSDSLEPLYYLYVLYSLKALEGSVLARDNAERALEECRSRARFRRNRATSYEWLGQGEGLTRLVHRDRLGDWNRNADFWTDPSLLARVSGVVAKIQRPEAGTIETEGGLKAFYVPAKAGHYRGASENQRVTLFLGFSYDGPRAWSVEDVVE